jgi:protein SCO1/2
MFRHRLSRAAAAIAAITATACAPDGSTQRTISGIRSDPAPSVAGLTLPDASSDGAAFTLVPGDGRYLVVYFGYTACPDVCPTTMHEVEVALRELGDRAALVEVAMVTIDPTRDLAEPLTRYVQGFVPTAHALRTDDDELLHKAAEAFGASFTVSTAADGTVEVGHTPNLYLVDDTGSLVLTWPFGLPGASIANDLEILMETP